MSSHPLPETPPFLDTDRPDVPDIVVPRGLTPFRMPRCPVRGRLVRLCQLTDALLTRHDHHPVVAKLLGEALALAAGLASALKFRGSFSVQAKGNGPVPVLLADCTDGGALRGYARAETDVLTRLLDRQAAPTVADLLGSGYLAFTVDQGEDRERHQGIVAIEGESLAAMALHYFETSEQLRCYFHLACERGPDGWRAGALMLEKVAGGGGAASVETDEVADEESWRTATILAATLSDAELLDEEIAPEHLLNRLFHSEGVVADRSRALSFGCRCSRARLFGILEGFPTEDLDHMAENGQIVMTCEFCNHDFRFPRAEVRGQGEPG